MAADTDGDGISDGDEVLVHSSNPLSTDTDADDMPDAWEVTHGLALLTANTYDDDDDGDRYPNVFECTYSTDPSDRASTPTPTYTVNSAGGGTHTNISSFDRRKRGERCLPGYRYRSGDVHGSSER